MDDTGNRREAKRTDKKKSPEMLPKEDADYSATPFDDIWRTIAARLHRSLILLMNRIFGTSFTGDEKLEPGSTEMMLLKIDGTRVRRGVDSHFAITDGSGHRHAFHVECQTNPDGTIVLRFAEYDMQIAVEGAVMHKKGRAYLYLPQSAVINLRGRAQEPQEIVIVDKDQRLVHHVENLNMSDLSINDLLKPDGLALLPFYIFTHKEDLRRLAKNPETAQQLVDEFQYLCTCLEQLEETGVLNTYEHITELDLIRKAVRNAVPESIVSEEVGEMAYGRILALESDRFKSREEALQNGQKALQDRQKALQDRQKALQAREEAVETREEALKAREAKVDEAASAIMRQGKVETILSLVRDGLIPAAVGAAKLEMDEASFEAAYHAGSAE